jgi:hypothetical protein
MRMKIIEQWIAQAALSFAIRQLAQFGEETNWDTVKKDFDTRVRDLVPGDWFDNQAADVSNEIISAVERALKNTKTLKIIGDLAIEGKTSEAIARLRDYLLKAWKPDTAAGVKAMSLVELTKKNFKVA